jgi:putative endonuclease
MSEQIGRCIAVTKQSKDQVEALWFVYVVRTRCNTLYTGITTNVDRRFHEHLACFNGVSNKGAKYFRGRQPKEVVYTESCENRSIASKRECEIKKMSKNAKKELIGE